MEYTGWCQNDFNVQGYEGQVFARARVAHEEVRLRAGWLHAWGPVAV